jgi:chromosome segregation ATPase
VLSPIDGRVGDINRRTEHARLEANGQLEAVAHRLEQLIGQLDQRTEHLQQTIAEAESRSGARIGELSQRIEQARSELARYEEAAIENGQLTAHELRRLDDSVRTLDDRLAELARSEHEVRTTPRIRAAE